MEFAAIYWFRLKAQGISVLWLGRCETPILRSVFFSSVFTSFVRSLCWWRDLSVAMELPPTWGYSLWANSNLSWGPVTEPFVVVHFELLPPTGSQYFFPPALWFWKLSHCSYSPFRLAHLQQQCVPLQRVAQKSVDTRYLIFCLYSQVNFAPLCTSPILAVTAREGELVQWDISIQDLNIAGYWFKIYVHDDIRLHVVDVDMEFFMCSLKALARSWLFCTVL